MSAVDYENIQESVEQCLGAHPQGWAGHVTRLFEHIKAHCDQKELEYPEVFQIKQKLGELRIYLAKSNEDQTIKGWIAGTIQHANHSCELCGNAAIYPEMIQDWYLNLCCFCAHDEAAKFCSKDKRRLFKRTAAPAYLTCSVCGYVGQVDRTDDPGRCPACVSKNWTIK